uniref:Uncharacterized protein n=1 Tax=Anguilla anguilla TaxID=7936 RepID=A0A0E9T197_ANGAN
MGRELCVLPPRIPTVKCKLNVWSYRWIVYLIQEKRTVESF